jgi:hypothetical protein
MEFSDNPPPECPNLSEKKNSIHNFFQHNAIDPPEEDGLLHCPCSAANIQYVDFT